MSEQESAAAKDPSASPGPPGPSDGSQTEEAVGQTPTAEESAQPPASTEDRQPGAEPQATDPEPASPTPGSEPAIPADAGPAPDAPPQEPPDEPGSLSDPPAPDRVDAVVEETATAGVSPAESPRSADDEQPEPVAEVADPQQAPRSVSVPAVTPVAPATEQPSVQTQETVATRSSDSARARRTSRRRRAAVQPRVAIVHDYLNQMGGAERVLEVLHEIYPDAPIYTSMYDPALVSDSFARMDVRPSFMQRVPWASRRHQMFLPLYPAAFEQFDLSDYDLVLSMSSAWSKGVVTQPETCHVCYCLTPMRFAWQAHAYAAQERIPGWARWVLPHLLSWLRTWDVTTAQRVDAFAVISRSVAQRVAKYYRRSATIIHPPVDTCLYQPADSHDDFFLVVSRLIPYKRIDLAVRACTELGLPLKVVGIGRDLPRLQALAGPTVEFLGRLPDATIRQLMARCRALIFPGAEDFGLTPIEAQASGRPVIALARGGALETVVDGRTGVLFPAPTVESLAAALQQFRDSQFDHRLSRRHAARFDTARFRERLQGFVTARLALHRADLHPPPPRPRRRRRRSSR